MTADFAYQVIGFAYQGDGELAYQGNSGAGGGGVGVYRRRPIIRLHRHHDEARQEIELRIKRSHEESQYSEPSSGIAAASEITRQSLMNGDVVTMSQEQIDAEISFLLQKKLRTQNEEYMLVLLMVAAVV